MIRKNNKRALYESIMRDVSKVIKKHLNENIEDEPLLNELLEYINNERDFTNFAIKDALRIMEEDKVSLDQASILIYDNLWGMVALFADKHNLDVDWIESIDLKELFYKFVDAYSDEIWNKNNKDIWDD